MRVTVEQGLKRLEHKLLERPAVREVNGGRGRVDFRMPVDEHLAVIPELDERARLVKQPEFAGGHRYRRRNIPPEAQRNIWRVLPALLKMHVHFIAGGRRAEHSPPCA